MSSILSRQNKLSINIKQLQAQITHLFTALALKLGPQFKLLLSSVIVTNVFITVAVKQSKLTAAWVLLLNNTKQV